MRPRSLKAKILLPFLLAITVLAIALVTALALFQREQSQQRMLTRAQLIANMVNYAAESSGRSGELQRIVTALGAEDDILDIIVAAGAPARVIASTRSSWLGSPLADIPGEEFAEDLSRAMASGRPHSHYNEPEQLFDFSMPLWLSQRDIAQQVLVRGAVMIHVDTRPIRAAAEAVTMIWAIMCLAVLAALGALGFFLVQRYVLRPTQAIAALIGGDAAARDPRWSAMHTGDELGMLAITLQNALLKTHDAVSALTDSETRYKRIANFSSDVIFEIAADGELRFISPACANVLGYPPEKMTGTRLYEWIHPDDVAQAREQVGAVLANNFIGTITCRFRRVDGEFFWMESSLRGLRVTPTAPAQALVGVARDVTDRMAAETELRDHAGFTQAVLDNLLDAVIVIDEFGVIEAVNPAVTKLFGYPADAVIGRNVSLLMPPPHRHQHDQYIANYRATHVARIIGIGREVEGQYKDGGMFPLELAVIAVSRHGKPKFVGITRDVSERKRVERLKNEFVSAVSHELRTPMNAILGFTQLLGFDTNLTDTQRANLLKVRHAGEHLLNIVNDVLDLSRIEAGKVELSLEAVSVRALFAECGALIQHQAAAQQIRFLADARRFDQTYLCADRTRVRQVVLNLLSNAVKYNRPGGDVWLTCDAGESGSLRIGIRDNGPGIAPEKQADLFKPFNRLGAERGEIEGTGIGLTITKQLTEMMHGRIGVFSTAGAGCLFWVEFPLTEGSALPAAASAAPQMFTPLAGQYALLYVEDNPVNVAFMQAVCARLLPDSHLLCAESAEEGLNLAATNLPDAILMDINLPGMDGYAALAHLKADPRLRHIPVVAVTANATKENIARGRAAGFADYLTKPIDIAGFRATVARLLPDKQTPRSASEPGTRVLVAEDNLVNQEVVRAMLSHLGYACDIVADGRAAVEAATRTRYAVILMDCEMPVLDGYAATQAIRMLDGNAGKTPIVALTAHAAEENETQRVAVGMDDFLAKPLLLDALQAILTRWAGSQRAISTPAPTPPSPADPILDARITGSLKTLLGARVVAVVDLLLNDLPQGLQRFKDAVARGDLTSARAEAHTMKGSSSNLGAARYAELCAQADAARYRKAAEPVLRAGRRTARPHGSRVTGIQERAGASRCGLTRSLGTAQNGAPVRRQVHTHGSPGDIVESRVQVAT